MDRRKLEDALLDAADRGDSDAVELLKSELKALGNGARTPNVAAAPAGAANAPTRGGSTASGFGPRSRAVDPAQAQARETMSSGFREAAKSIPQVLGEAGKQLITLGMLPGEAVSYGVDKLSGGDAEWGRGTKMLTEGIDSLIPPPETRPGKRAAAVGGAAVSGAVLPGGALRNAITGMLGAGGGEAGATMGQNIAGDSGGVMGGVIGSLAGGVGTVHRGAGGYKQMLADALKGTNPQDFSTATRLQKEANRLGIPLTPEQTLPFPTGLDTLVRETLESGAGTGKLQEVLISQRLKAEEAAKGAGNQLGPRVEDREATRTLRNALEKGIKQEGAMTPSGKALYGDKAGAMVTPQQLSTIRAGLDEVLASTPIPEIQTRIKGMQKLIDDTTKKLEIPTKTTKQVLETRTKGAAKRLMKTVEEPGVIELPLGADTSDLSQIANWVKGEMQDIKLNTPGIERLMTGKLGAAVKRVDTALDEAIPTRVQADDLFKSASGRREDLTSSLAGQLVGRTGVDQAAPDSLNLIRSVFGSGKLVDKEIAEVGSVTLARARNLEAEAARVGKIDPLQGTELMKEAQAAREAIPQAARSLYDEAVGRALRAGGEGRTPANFGAILHDDLIGTPEKKANFKALMLAAGAAKGVDDPKAFAQGFESLLQVLQASGRNRAGVKMSIADIQTASGQSPLRTAVQATGSLARENMISTKLRQLAFDRQYTRLSNIFSDPEALRLVQEMGKESIMSPRQGAMASAVLQMVQDRSDTAKER